MSFKSRDELDRLLYAPDGDDQSGDGGDGGDDKPAGGGEESPEIKALKSTHDKQIADLNKSIKDLQAKIDEGAKSTSRSQSHQRAIQSVNAELAKLDDEDDPERQVKLAREIISKIGEQYATVAATNTELQGAYKESLAAGLAADIAFENGGDPATYKARLMQSPNETQMRADATLLRAETKNGNGNTSNNSNGNQQRRPSPDNGRGQPVTTNLIAEIQDDKFDPWTPEGQNAWRESKGKLAKAAGLSA